MKRLAKFATAIAVLALVSACSQGMALEPGTEAPDFTLTDMNGTAVSFSSFKGKVIILDFFASWCPPCRQEIPDFIALQDAYGDKGLAMVGVAMVSREEAKEFAGQMGINYPVLVDDGKVSVTYGPVRAIPTTLVIDRNFKVAKVYIGYRAKDVFENDIKELLK